MPLDSLSPVDGRYRSVTEPLAPYFSEWGLIRYRTRVEVEWLREMASTPALSGIPPLSEAANQVLSRLVDKFSQRDAERVKALEATTQHDVKAVEYFIREHLQAVAPELLPFVHFACTSDDINNLAYALMLKDSLEQVLLPKMRAMVERVADLARQTRATPMLSWTHGQPATPSTLGKELAVFVLRWRRQLKQLERTEFLGKFNGAVGTWGAHLAAYPKAAWVEIARHFVTRLGLQLNPLTTQIEPHDYMAELFQNLMRFNAVSLDFVKDMWLYIARGYFHLRVVTGEVGSSTMPHKVNPIQFENAEANFGVANSLLDHLAGKLPISRLQRDLTDSSALRTVGPALGHTLIGVVATLRGLQSVTPDAGRMAEDLNDAWEVLSEAVQTVLRKNGRPDAYELMKDLTRGRAVGQDVMREAIAALDIAPEDRAHLLALTPATYTGLAAELVDLLDESET
jgi:adenylosuccinate lyase